jgi:hypothetical protein
MRFSLRHPAKPYIHNRQNGDVELQIPASGLVAAASASPGRG